MKSTTDRVSIPVMKEFESGREFNVSMFTEDLYQDIVPFSSRDYLNSCFLKPGDKATEKQLIELLASFSQFDKRNISDAVFNTIRNIASGLVTAGFIALELVKMQNEDKSVNYRMVYIPGDIEVTNEHILQHLTAEEASNWETEQIIKIPLEKCWVIDFPKELGGKQNYLKFLEELKVIGNSDPFRIFLKNELRDLKEYEIGKHHKLTNLTLWKKTKEFGWHHRETSDKMFSGYFLINRRLRFRRSQFILRDHIIAELKKHIKEFFNSIGKNVELTIENIGSLESVAQAIEDWTTGKLPQNQILTYLTYKWTT